MPLMLPPSFVALRGEACSLLAAARQVAVEQLGASLAAQCDDRVVALLGGDTSAHAAGGRLGPALGRLVDQFVVQVSSVTSEMIDAAMVECAVSGLDRDALVRSFYVVEFTRRLGIVTSLLFAGDAERVVPSAISETSLRALMSRYQESVVRGDAIDATLTELVRLRCARTHQCEICSTLRLASARDEGVDAAVTQMVDHYESSSLPERAKVALRLTDAFILHPSGLTDALVLATRSTFSDVELVELCLDITKWSTQKVNVALGTDGIGDLPVNTDGVAYFGFDVDGRVAGYSPV